MHIGVVKEIDQFDINLRFSFAAVFIPNSVIFASSSSHISSHSTSAHSDTQLLFSPTAQVVKIHNTEHFRRNFKRLVKLLFIKPKY